MGGINPGRVLLGGIVAGIVLNAVDGLVATVILADEMTAMATRMNLDPVAAQNMWPWVGVDFVYGILIVFAYAAMRPRFGAGARTAAIAGLTLWLAISAILYGFLAMGIFTAYAYLVNVAFTAAGTVVAAIAGAWLYKE